MPQDHPTEAREPGFTPVRAELPLDAIEAFRLASFGIEYVPQYAPVYWDRDTANSRQYRLSAYNLSIARRDEDARRDVWWTKTQWHGLAHYE